jgi:hypothetical protein
MLSCLSVSKQWQTTIKRIVLCSGCVGLSLLAIIWFGYVPRTQAAQKTLPMLQPSAGLVTLRGNTRPEANAKNDRGRVSGNMTLNHMMLLLQRTPEQEQALQQFIGEIHDPTSPLFHHWIQAAEFEPT